MPRRVDPPSPPPTSRRASLIANKGLEVRCIVVTPVARARGLWHIVLDGRSASGAMPRAEAIAAGLALGQRIATPTNHVCVFLTESGAPLKRDNLVLELVPPPAPTPP